ncbi:flagellar hook-basal body protein [Paenibacillus sp. Marseille-P2973]|uniref:flagellar hook-basal body protein n=1 Tax=Paenibacillus sp. Marseille-P2973 TaxID=1871032 RepID=UPI001B37EA3B|nr:flagellar hook-basal body protein [Paenibacillus sp. Marseille-P2973]MBQ4900051.1 flagellar hook-basal body protein [Paenibacillus sp. Marseille-P2973]
MLRGLYTAASGMITQQRRHDTVTQNIANINTPGYKQVNAVSHSFPDMLISLVGDKESGNAKRIGKLSTGVFAEESLASYVQGDLRETGKASNFGLLSSLNLNDPATGLPIAFDASGKYLSEDGEVIYRPEAFFSVLDNNDQVRYTRDGNFTVNAAGDLLTSQGQRVLGVDGNPIVLPAGMSINQVQSDAVGNFVYYENGVAVPVARLGVAVVNRPQELVREGNGVYRAEDPEAADIRIGLTVEDEAAVRQGYLETSNVDTAQAMVDLLAAQRAYESNQKIIQYYDKSLDRAVNDIGRV